MHWAGEPCRCTRGSQLPPAWGHLCDASLSLPAGGGSSSHEIQAHWGHVGSPSTSEDHSVSNSGETGERGEVCGLNSHVMVRRLVPVARNCISPPSPGKSGLGNSVKPASKRAPCTAARSLTPEPDTACCPSGCDICRQRHRVQEHWDPVSTLPLPLLHHGAGATATTTSPTGAPPLSALGGPDFAPKSLKSMGDPTELLCTDFALSVVKHSMD